MLTDPQNIRHRTPEEHEKALSKIEEKRTAKMEWLDMETYLVEVLRSVMTSNQKVRVIEQVIDTYTGRGYFY